MSAEKKPCLDSVPEKILQVKEKVKIGGNICYYECLGDSDISIKDVSVLGKVEDKGISELIRVLAARQLIASDGQCVLPKTKELMEYARYLSKVNLINNFGNIVWVKEEEYLNPATVFKAIKERGYDEVLAYEKKAGYKKLAEETGLKMYGELPDGDVLNPGKKNIIRNIVMEVIGGCPYTRVIYDKKKLQWEIIVAGKKKWENIDELEWEDKILKFFLEGKGFFKGANSEKPLKCLMVQIVQGDAGVGNDIIYRDENGYYVKDNETKFQQIDNLSEYIKNFLGENSSEQVEITPYLNPEDKENLFCSASKNYFIDGLTSFELPIIIRQLTDVKVDYQGASSISNDLTEKMKKKLNLIDTDKIFQIITDLGISGWFGIDWQIYKDLQNDSWEIFVTEMNNRFTGISQSMRLLLDKSPQTFTAIMSGEIDFIEMDHLHLLKSVNTLEDFIKMLKELEIPIWENPEDKEKPQAGLIIKGVPHNDQTQVTFIGKKKDIIKWLGLIDPENAKRFFPEYKDLWEYPIIVK